MECSDDELVYNVTNMECSDDELGEFELLLQVDVDVALLDVLLGAEQVAPVLLTLLLQHNTQSKFEGPGLNILPKLYPRLKFL